MYNWLEDEIHGALTTRLHLNRTGKVADPTTHIIIILFLFSDSLSFHFPFFHFSPPEVLGHHAYITNYPMSALKKVKDKKEKEKKAHVHT